MRIADTIPFSPELIGPLHQETYRRRDATPGPGDVTLDSSWSIRLNADDAVVHSAAEHLRGFMSLAMGTPPADRPTEKAVTLTIDPSVGENPESHLLKVSEDGIEISGAGPLGVLQGVFRLEAHMKQRGGPFVPSGEEQRSPLFAHRIHRSALSPFYVDELSGYNGPPYDVHSWNEPSDFPGYIEEDAGPQTYYHDNMLVRLLEHGVNAIWLRGALREFSRVKDFPEFGTNAETILGELRDLCQRAGKYGMRVFLYMNEPLGFDKDDVFWQNHPELKGSLTLHAPIYCMCTSHDSVKRFLREGNEYIFSQVPELAGVILISASEFPSHCYCHQNRPEDPAEQQKLVTEERLCPTCLPRTPQEVVAEVVTLIRDGVKAGNPQAEVIAWNWSWSFYEKDPQMGILERLPRDVIVMGDFERGEPSRALDFDYMNDEYSIKVVGPSPRFMGVADFQRSRGMPVYAKIQIGTTHENPNIPYLPTMQKIAAKYHALYNSGVTGMMTCWNFGNMTGHGLEVANEFAWAPQEQDINAGLRCVAARNFGEPAADDVVAAWEAMSKAQDDFPGSIPVMYHGPVSRGPAFPLCFDIINKHFPRSWILDRDTRGDILDNWVIPFGAEKTAQCYRAVAKQWETGIDLLTGALEKTEGADRCRLERELGLAKICLIQLVSAAHVVEFLLARNAWYESSDPDEKMKLLDRIEAICLAEIENAEAALPLCDADSRLGWHGEAYGYMYNRPLIEEKVAAVRELVNERLPRERNTIRQS